jgi:hypothetical protein
MKRHTFLFLFISLLCLAYSLPAQISLTKKKLPKVSVDTAVINKITREARKLVLTGQYKEAIKQIEKAEILAKKGGYKSGLATCFNLKGIISYRQAVTRMQ